MGVDIVGVSFTDPDYNLTWVESEAFQYEIWTDEDKTLALTYGSITTALAPIPGRVTVLLDSDGELLLEYPSVDVNAHPQEVLEDCQALFASTN